MLLELDALSKMSTTWEEMIYGRRHLGTVFLFRSNGISEYTLSPGNSVWILVSQKIKVGGDFINWQDTLFLWTLTKSLYTFQWGREDSIHAEWFFTHVDKRQALHKDEGVHGEFKKKQCSEYIKLSLLLVCEMQRALLPPAGETARLKSYAHMDRLCCSGRESSETPDLGKTKHCSCCMDEILCAKVAVYQIWVKVMCVIWKVLLMAANPKTMSTEQNISLDGGWVYYMILRAVWGSVSPQGCGKVAVA